MPKSEQGLSDDRYMCIPRTLIFVMRGDEVLLLKGAPTKRIWANKYNGVGGHVERGEDLLSAAKRELLEETGLAVPLRLVGTLLVDVEPVMGVCISIFRGEASCEEPRPSVEGDLVWLPSDGLEGYPLVEDVSVLLARILEMGEYDPPFSARSFYDQDEKLQVLFGE